MKETKIISAESAQTFKYLKDFFAKFLKLLQFTDDTILLERELEIVRDFTEEKLSKKELEEKYSFTPTRLNEILRESRLKLLRLIGIAQKALEEKKDWNAILEKQKDENFVLSEINKKLKHEIEDLKIENYRLKHGLP